MTQVAKILDHMRGGAHITPLGALGLYGVARLAARIHDIKQMGYHVEARTVTGNGKRWAEYRMPA